MDKAGMGFHGNRSPISAYYFYLSKRSHLFFSPNATNAFLFSDKRSWSMKLAIALPNQFLSGITEHLEQCSIHVSDNPFSSETGDAVTGVFEQITIASFTLFQGFLCPPTGGHV